MTPLARTSRILVADDDPAVVDAITHSFEREQFEVEVAEDGEEALEKARTKQFDVVILNVMMPRLFGTDVCRTLRAESDVPIILLSARDGELDRVLGLELGADDYVTKPFSPRELAARVRSVLRRSDGTSPQRETIAFGEIELDGSSREARRGGSAVQLTAKEFELLWFLASHPRHVFSRDQLMARVWGYEAAVDTGTVTVHVRRLREKIEPDPSRPVHLHTVWGVGYRLDP